MTLRAKSAKKSGSKTRAAKPKISKPPDDGRHFPSRPVVGIGVVVWRDDKVLLIKRGHPPRQGEWGLPGGMQQLGETIMQAAIRETREETGLDITPLGIITAIDAIIPSTTPGRTADIEFHYTIIEVLAEALPGEAKAQDDATDLRWAGLDEIENLCRWPEVARIVRLSALQRVL